MQQPLKVCSDSASWDGDLGTITRPSLIADVNNGLTAVLQKTGSLPLRQNPGTSQQLESIFQ